MSFMNRPPCCLVWLTALALAATPAGFAQVTVSNISAAQRSGTKLVDIHYDLSGGTSPVAVSLDISADGGVTWSVPASTLTGDVGSKVPPATGLKVTWNAGNDWNDQYSTRTRFRIQIADSLASSEFSRIPVGSFTMGDALDRDADAPSHSVSLSSFFLQKNEVSQAQWNVVRAWALGHGYSKLASGASKGINHPIEKVTWYDVVKWCNAKSEMEGLKPCYYTNAAKTTIYRTGTKDINNTMVNWNANGYRLPTEAEWEKSARGGLTGKRFPWGDDITHTDANYNSRIADAYDISTTLGFHPTYATGGTPYTAPANSFDANGYGLYHMAGNVREWVWDCYATTYDTTAATDPHGPATGTTRVLRGGDWSYYALGCRVAYRYRITPSITDDAFGFRPARSILITGQSPNTLIDSREWVLTINPLSHGSIAGAANGDQILSGSIVSLTAVPSPGFLFTAWSGASTSTDKTLALLMDDHKTLGATFLADNSDADHDGLNAYDEVVIYGTNPNLADSDGDGLRDGYEAGIGRFSIISGSFTWAKARADAHARGGELACFATETLWKRAMASLDAGALAPYLGLWIGASDTEVDGTWKWVNGQAFAFTYWATNKPSSVSGNTLDYAEIVGDAGKWVDCSSLLTRDAYLLEIGYSTDPKNPDSDGDGLTDGKEVSVYHSNPILADSDADGFGDGFEVMAGYNPTLATSTPDLLSSIHTGPASVPSSVEFRFNAAKDAIYQIESSTDLITWNLIEDSIVGQGAPITRSYSTMVIRKRFFRASRN
ncbi:MAG: hypothetical protein RLZZ282_1124 [Verrucomicrobiota bacterium]